MSQSALTVTPPNPTPPTNMSCTGATPPNPPNFQRQNYANPFNLTAARSGAGGVTLAGDERPQTPYGVNPNPPPYFDDGAAGSLTAFAANTAALTSGTSAADNGTGTTPGTAAAGAGGTGYNSVSGSYPGVANGLVPASSSTPHEGAGTEVVFTQTYSAAVYNPAGPLVTVSTTAPYTVTPNRDHASSLSPATNPVIGALTPSTTTSGTGTFSLGVAGTNYTRQSVIYINNIPQTTTFNSATSLTAPTALKKTTAGSFLVKVVTGGVVETATATMNYT